MAKKIYISPSDQVNNKYAYGNTTEAAQCRLIAKALYNSLTRCGFACKTNTQDGKNAMYIRERESNNWGADMHLCLHTNAGGGKGCEVYINKKDEKHLKPANLIYNAIKKISLYGSSRGVKTARWHEIVYTTGLCVYVEIDFHDNKLIAKWIIEHTNEIAEAICKAICEYYGVKYVKKTESTETAKLYRVQVGAFSEYKNADKLKKELVSKGYSAIIV